MDSTTINTLSQTQTILYSFTAGYMVSQLNILGFALGCGFTYALQYIPNNFKDTFFDKMSQHIYFLEKKDDTKKETVNEEG